MKILIVEDDAAELVQAVRIAQEMGLETVVSETASKGARMVCELRGPPGSPSSSYTPLVDGVVTDIFLPYFERGDKRHNSDSPCGVLVAMAAIAAKIPWVFCTGGNHHGSKLQWITSMDAYMPVYMVDTGESEEMDAPKDWRKALENVRARAEICKRGKQ